MPRKKKLNLSSKITVNSKEKWEKILSDIDKPEVPIQVLDRICIRLVDGTKINIDVGSMLAEQGAEPEAIEHHLHQKLEELDNVIEDIDFFVNIDAVAKTIQTQTDFLLGKL